MRRALSIQAVIEAPAGDPQRCNQSPRDCVGQTRRSASLAVCPLIRRF